MEFPFISTYYSNGEFVVKIVNEVNLSFNRKEMEEITHFEKTTNASTAVNAAIDKAVNVLKERIASIEALRETV